MDLELVNPEPALPDPVMEEFETKLQAIVRRIDQAIYENMRAAFFKKYARYPAEGDKLKRSLRERKGVKQWTFYYQSRKGIQRFATVEVAHDSHTCHVSVKLVED
jgi:hypothetical protein